MAALCASAAGLTDATGAPSDDAVKSRLEPTDRRVAVFPPGAPQPWRWTLATDDPHLAQAASLTWALHYWDGRKQEGKVEVAKDGDASFAWSIVPEQRGWARLEARLLSGDGAVLASEETTLVTGSAAPKEGRHFRYALNQHMGRDMGKDTEAVFLNELDLIDMLGVDMVRGNLEWASVERTAGNKDYTRFDRLVNGLVERQIPLQGLLAYTPKWATTGDPNAADWKDWARRMPRWEPWRDFVQTTVRRYQGKVHYWEIWNEPDISFWRDSTENFVTFHNKTAREIRQIDPRIQIVNGGFAMAPNKANPGFRNAFVKAADPAPWSVRAYHDYFTYRQMISRFEEVRRLFKASPVADLPIWINEGGFHTLLRGGEKLQAVELVKKYAAAPSLDNVVGYFWYVLNDGGIKATDSEQRFGLVDYYHRPRPGFGAFQNLIRELAPRLYFSDKPDSASKVADRDRSLRLYAYAASADGVSDHRVVAWREGGDAVRPYLFHWTGDSTKPVGASDLMGNPVACSIQDNAIAVSLGAEPIYIHMAGKAAYPQATPFLEFADTIALVPGVATSFVVGINNPTHEDVEVELSGAMTSAPNDVLFAKTTTVNAGQLQHVTIDQDLSPGANGEDSLQLRARFSGVEHFLEARVPLKEARIIGRREENREWRTVLNTVQDVVNLHDGLAAAEYAWKGPADLSVQVLIAYDDKALEIIIEARDDRHIQEGDVSMLWQQDSVQLALQPIDKETSALELELALGPKGTVSWVAVPLGELVLGSLPKTVAADVSRNADRTLYKLSIPWKALGMPAAPASPLRISFLVNDNDGDGGGRKQWIELSPGIGKEKNPTLFPLFICK